MTPAEQWRAEGRNMGRAEGRAELLLRMLSVRFRRVPASTVERIRSASEDDLTRWAERLLTADALDAVFSG